MNCLDRPCFPPILQRERLRFREIRGLSQVPKCWSLANTQVRLTLKLTLPRADSPAGLRPTSRLPSGSPRELSPPSDLCASDFPSWPPSQVSAWCSGLIVKAFCRRTSVCLTSIGTGDCEELTCPVGDDHPPLNESRYVIRGNLEQQMGCLERCSPASPRRSRQIAKEPKDRSVCPASTGPEPRTNHPPAARGAQGV